MTRLSDLVSIEPRFSRSANIERDYGADSIRGYVPTGRALDLLRRIARGLADPAAGRAFSVVGPHGGGKSSFAVFLHALFEPKGTEAQEAALATLAISDPLLAEEWRAAIEGIDPQGTGALCAYATASQESVTRTISRALDGNTGQRGDMATATRSEPVEVLARVRSLATRRPLVIVIDEFGKNLQSYAASGIDGDPYLLQEIAESAQGASALPILLITMQHLSFDEYVTEASTARRREWAKVQGRFQDVPYVETPRQARALIASTIRHSGGLKRLSDWANGQSRTAEDLGLTDLAEVVGASYPLHPLTLAVLPDLCSRYGQNERTLFSFLAGPEPLSVPEFLKSTPVPARGKLPTVGLDRVYDYFLDSAATSVGAAASASRWLEIETRIRDTYGLTELQSQVLKSVGVLNLVSSGGAVRASRPILRWATEHTTESEFAEVIRGLEERGLITYRDFADEFRIWSGSDFDLRGAVETARREAALRPLPSLLNEHASLEPIVAGRHSQKHGVLRVYRRFFSDGLPEAAELNAPKERQWDGHVVYLTDRVQGVRRMSKDERPLVLVEPHDIEGVREAALEAAALLGAIKSVESRQADWVAQRELHERLSIAQQELAEHIARAWNLRYSRWVLANTETQLDARAGASVALSEASDVVYRRTPNVANEMIARRELTSQGAKARRFLIDAMIAHPDSDCFGIEGYPAQRAMYEALFRSTGLHQGQADGSWILRPQARGNWASVWKTIDDALAEATDRRINLQEVYDRLTAPPIGLKDGILPVLMITALLVRASGTALYEHGTLVLSIDDAIAERLAKNPGHFSVKNLAAERGARLEAVRALAESLRISSYRGEPTFLQVAQALYREMRALPPFTHQTTEWVSSRASAVRKAFQTANEPDVLIFETLPSILDLPPFATDSDGDLELAMRFASGVSSVVLELRAAYPALLADVEKRIADATATNGSGDELRKRLHAQAATIEGRVLEPRLKSFVGATSREHLEFTEWVENLAMVVAEGRAPRVWTDELAGRFALQINEVGGALRRTLALFFERQATAKGFTARRVTVTNPDGSESSDVLVLTDVERDLLESRVSTVVESLAEDLGSIEAARRSLLAWLVTPPKENAISGDVAAPRRLQKGLA